MRGGALAGPEQALAVREGIATDIPSSVSLVTSSSRRPALSGRPDTARAADGTAMAAADGPVLYDTFPKAAVPRAR